MTFKVFAPETKELKPRIVVFGVGGAGGNAVNNMIEAGLEGVEFVVANTDAQQLAFAKTERRVQLGVQVTQGLGAGAHPEVGMSAAEESTTEIGEHLDGAHMVFITAGMGGGTGTGAGPIIAQDEAEAKRLSEAFARGDVRRIRSLRRGSMPDETCWLSGDGWWLSTREAGS